MSYALTYIKSQKKNEGVKKYYSELLQDTFVMTDSGEIKFNSGVVYSRSELDKIRDLNNEAKKFMHTLKKIFSGEII